MIFTLEKLIWVKDSERMKGVFHCESNESNESSALFNIICEDQRIVWCSSYQQPMTTLQRVDLCSYTDYDNYTHFKGFLTKFQRRHRLHEMNWCFAKEHGWSLEMDSFMLNAHEDRPESECIVGLWNALVKCQNSKKMGLPPQWMVPRDASLTFKATMRCDDLKCLAPNL